MNGVMRAVVDSCLRPVRAAVATAVCTCLWLPAAKAAGTAANTLITNTATASYQDGNTGLPGTATSNSTSLRVDEVLGATLVSNEAGPVAVSTPTSQGVLSFTLGNPGNGNEAYALTVDTTLAGDQYDPANVRIYLDSNGNGRYDAGSDALYVPGSNALALDPDHATVIFVLADTPAARLDGDIGNLRLTATALTGSGAAGTVFGGQGTGGTDAVVGPTTATAQAQAGFRVAEVSNSLLKSQVVRDRFGGSLAMQGSVITYTLVLRVDGTGSLADAAITDAIPADTTYVAGSLTLDGSGLSDAADADAGQFSTTGIRVNLGDIVAPAIKTITFQTSIN